MYINIITGSAKSGLKLTAGCRCTPIWHITHSEIGREYNTDSRLYSKTLLDLFTFKASNKQYGFMINVVRTANM